MEQKEFQKEKKANFSLKGIFILFFLFILTLGLGIFSGLRIINLFKFQKIEIVTISFWEFLLNFVVAIILIVAAFILGRKFKGKKRILYKLLFVISTGFGALISLGVIFEDVALFLVLILSVLWLKKPCVLLQDILVVFGIAGTGSYLGVKMEPLVVVGLLVVFSIYDYLAVYKTKHMVKMAKEMVKEQAILGLVLPQKISDFKASLAEVIPGGERFFILGGGDMAFPLLLSCSVLHESLQKSLVVAFFSFIGFLFTIFLFLRQKKHQPIPALPPIALFSIIGYLITKLIQ